MTRAAWMESVARGQRAGGGGEGRAPAWALDCPGGCRVGAGEERGASVGRPAEAGLPVSSRAARPGGLGAGLPGRVHTGSRRQTAGGGRREDVHSKASQWGSRRPTEAAGSSRDLCFREGDGGLAGWPSGAEPGGDPVLRGRGRAAGRARLGAFSPPTVPAARGPGVPRASRPFSPKASLALGCRVRACGGLVSVVPGPRASAGSPCLLSPTPSLSASSSPVGEDQRICLPELCVGPRL